MANNGPAFPGSPLAQANRKHRFYHQLSPAPNHVFGTDFPPVKVISAAGCY